jgi:hypothetical protein
MEAVELSKLSEKEFLEAIKRITDDTKHNPAIAVVQIGTMLSVRLKGFEEREAKEMEWLKEVTTPVNEGSIIDWELVELIPEPVTIEFILIEQVRINALDVEFLTRVEGSTTKEGSDIFIDQAVSDLMDFVSSEFSWDEGNSAITDHWFICNLLGRNPEPQVMSQLRTGKILIEGMTPELLKEITSDYPAYLESVLSKTLSGESHRDLVSEREGLDS